VIVVVMLISELKRELRQVNSGKPKLVKTAEKLAVIDRANLREQDVRELQGVDGRVVMSVSEDAEFRKVWENIVDVMEVFAPVETREETDDDGEVRFTAVASENRGDLKTEYRADGSLRVKALWAESAMSSMAVCVVDETHSL